LQANDPKIISLKKEYEFNASGAFERQAALNSYSFLKKPELPSVKDKPII
jgi:hypothetical protein